MAATPVDPLPAKGSRTTCSALVVSSINACRSFIGFWASCSPRSPGSNPKCRTLSVDPVRASNWAALNGAEMMLRHIVYEGVCVGLETPDDRFKYRFQIPDAPATPVFSSSKPSTFLINGTQTLRSKHGLGRTQARVSLRLKPASSAQTARCANRRPAKSSADPPGRKTRSHSALQVRHHS